MTVDPTALGSVLVAMFSPAVAVVAGPVELDDDALFPEERAYLGHAVRKRCAEFGSVRACARRALATLGIPAAPLVPQADRSPRWPAGVVGSLSHTDGWCAAAVARAADVGGLGLDLADDRPLDAAVVRAVCTPDERAADATVVFAAKEAFYKAQYPRTRAFVDFHEVIVHLDHTAGEFTVDVRRADLRPVAAAIRRARFTRVAGLVACTVELG